MRLNQKKLSIIVRKMRDDNFHECLVSLNVRFLLWNRDIPKVNWARWLMARVAWDEPKARQFLAGQLGDDQLTTHELSDLSSELGLPVDGSELRFEDLAGAQDSLLQDNLNYLFAGLEHGKKKDLAQKLGVSPTTISRWLSGKFEPRESMLNQLVLYFGLSAETDLRRTPVFLSMEPVTQIERRAWLLRQIKGMGQRQLNELYPALRLMLGGR